MDNEKYRCYACNKKMTKNGTEKRKNPDIRVQRYICKNTNCVIWNIFIIIESENQSLIGQYFFPKVKDRVFTYEQAVRRYKKREEQLNSSEIDSELDD